MRVNYETPETIQNEDVLANRLAEKYHAKVFKTQRKAPIDRIFVSEGQLVAVAEIKGRNYGKDDFADAMIEVEKVMRLRLAADALGCAALFLCGWTDWSGWVDLRTAPYRVDKGGRSDRGDPSDDQVCAYVPITSFRGL